MTRMRSWMMAGLGASWLLLPGCGDDDQSAGECSVESADGGGALIRCGDETTRVEPGGGGRDGGASAGGCSVRETRDAVVIECEDGSRVTVPNPGSGEPGEPGGPGDAGTPGEPGQPGEPAPLGWVTGPGLALELVEGSVDDERHPIARVRITDGDGVALDRAGLLTPGAVAPRFTVAALQQDGDDFADYESYILSPQTSPTTNETNDLPGSESNGTWTLIDAAQGLYEYRFATALPEGYDRSLTHTIGAWATRTVEDVRYAADAVVHFRPDGEDVAHVRDIAGTDSCNVCHNPLAAHGEQRLSVPLCVTCHTSQGVDPDTGNTIDFKVMVHKIHRGEELPSVQAGGRYEIVGFNDTAHDYSDVVFPHELNDCGTCHSGEQGPRWASHPSQAACGSCHDDVDFALAVPDPDLGDAIIPHPGGPKTDGTCTNCHAPQPAGLPGLSVEDAHQHGRLNPNTPTLEVEILAVEDTAPAETPTVTFRVRVDGVGRDILASPLERLSLVMAGPTTDFAGERSYSPQTDDAGSTTDQLVAVDAAAGEFAYTLPQTVAQAAAAFSTPVAAEGSFGFMMEARQTFAVPLPAGGTEDVRVAARNPVFFFPVTDAQAVPRRDVVDMDKCNGCHRDLYFHGDTRTVAEACVFCHTGNRDTLGRSPVPATGQTAIMTTARFGPMIHRIHGSAIADKPYVLFAPGGVPLDFTDIRFPGAPQFCLTCHVEGAYDLPLDPGLLPTTTRIKNDQGQSAGVADVVPATSSSCRGCHDSDAAAAHTEIMTTESGEESCAVCHAIGKSAGLDVVHARPEWEF